MTSSDAVFEGLETERTRPGLADLDARSTRAVVEQIVADDRSVPSAVAAVSEQLTTAVEAIAARFRDGGRLIYVGAGTPGRIAVIDATECAPTFGIAPE